MISFRVSSATASAISISMSWIPAPSMTLRAKSTTSSPFTVKRPSSLKEMLRSPTRHDLWVMGMVGIFDV